MSGNSSEITLSLKQRAWQEIERQRALIESLALRIRETPELGYQEFQASRWLSDALAKHNLIVERPYGGLETAFRATCSAGPGPSVALLAEYDALPDVGHGCGHNLIGPAAAGAALGVSAVLDEVGGTISVIGTPAEEYMGQVEGKLLLLEAGALQNIDVALMVHPQYANRVLGGDLGFVAFDLVFSGRPAHAAGDPWNGANALDGLLLTYNNINALRQHLQPDVRVHGIITEGGRAPNIIPERAAARFMVRSSDPARLEAAFARVQDCARAGALASGTELEIHQITTVYNSRINPELNRLGLANLALLGEPFEREPYQMGGSSDFGNVSQTIPAAMYLIRTHPADVPWHSAEVASLSGERMALDGMLMGAKLMAGAAIDVLADHQALSQIQEDFSFHER